MVKQWFQLINVYVSTVYLGESWDTIPQGNFFLCEIDSGAFLAKIF